MEDGRLARPWSKVCNEGSCVANYVGAIDQGTTSTRFMVFDQSSSVVACAQKEHTQIYPQPGWVEHDPKEIWRNTQEVITEAMRRQGLSAENLAAIGITNQRLRDNLGLIQASSEIESLARTVEDSGGLFRPGILRPVRAVLEGERARRDCRPYSICEQGAPRPRCSGSNRFPDA